MIKVADNSGARLVQVFRILGGSRKKYAGLGDIVIASVKVAEPRKAIKKKDIVKCVLIRQRNVYRRPDGSYVRFDENAVAVIDEKKQPRSTRIFGPLPREIREMGFEAIFQMAEEVV